MYTEIREVVNFLARYLFGRHPRRPTGIFTAELGNCMVTSFAGSGWDVNNPKNGEKERCIHIQCREGTFRYIQTAAEESGLNYHEILSLFPANLRIYVNPGEVFLRANDTAIDVPIWIGDVNADKDYQPNPEHVVRTAAGQADKNSNLGGAGKLVHFGRKPLPTTDKAVLELVNGCYVPLVLEELDDMNSNLQLFQQAYPYRFVFKPRSSQTFTGIEFSQTRFGSSKARPDLQTMHTIKQMAANQDHRFGSNVECSSSSRSSSPNQEQLFYSNYY